MVISTFFSPFSGFNPKNIQEKVAMYEELRQPLDS